MSSTQQEVQYRELIEVAPEPVFIADSEGRYTHVNRAACEMLGYSREELVGKPITELLDPAMHERLEQVRQEQMRGGLHRGEWELKAKDGTLVPVSFSSRMVADGRWIGFARDLREQKRAEHALEFQRGLMKQLTDNATTAIFMMDAHSRCTFMNPAAEKMTGFTFDEVRGGILHEFIHHHHPDGRRYPMPECPIDRALPEHFDVVGHQDVFIRKSGDFFPVEVNAKPIREGGVAIGTVIEVRDLTREREDMAKLRELTATLSEADRRKDEFLATLAHELRNPLAPIRNASTMLGSPKLRPDQLSWAARIIDRQVGQMAELLDDLLDVARITRGKLSIERRVCLLHEVIEAGVDNARSVIQDRRHELGIDIPLHDVEVWVDPLRVSQVLSNLLVNAARYTEPGGRINLAVEVEGDGVSFSVTDTGIGMEPSEIAGLFEMFAQGGYARNAAGGGLGIGLALSKALVGLHGGTITASSEGAGRGSVFHVVLPAAVAYGPKASTERAAPEASGMRVLVVDDNRDAADSLAAALELEGHEVAVAYCGSDALSMASRLRPDAGILDIGMPDMSGFELARALRRESWGRSIRLAALTGWGQSTDKQLAIDAGFDAHVTKPADPQELRTLLAAWSEQSTEH